MNYFERELTDEALIDESLKGLIKDCKKLLTKSDDKDIIRLHESTLGVEELCALNRAYLEGNITMGKYVNEYEKKVADKFKTKYCISSNSGSSANLLAIEALVQSGRLQEGNKVIVPKLAWSTSVFPLVQNGLIPVFVDISLEDFNLCLKDVESIVKEQDIQAVMLIHTYGNPCDMDKVQEICDTNNLILIEDTCESMGATWKGMPVGSFGVAGTFSSYYSHHICTFEGGLTVTNDKEIEELMKSIRSHGWIRGLTNIDKDRLNHKGYDLEFTFINTGYNLRLSDPQAAMGIEQVKKLDKFVERRRAAALSYKQIIKKDSYLSKAIRVQQENRDSKSSWFGFPILINNMNKEKIKKLREKLKGHGIETRPFLAGNFAAQPVNMKYDHIMSESNKIEIIDQGALAVPCHQGITTEETNRICYYLKRLLIDE